MESHDLTREGDEWVCSCGLRWDISLQQNLLIGVFYTVISFSGSYLLRRFYNWWHNR